MEKFIDIINETLGMASTVDDWTFNGRAYHYRGQYFCTINWNVTIVSPFGRRDWHNENGPTVIHINNETLQVVDMYFWINNESISNMNTFINHPLCKLDEDRKLELLLKYG